MEPVEVVDHRFKPSPKLIQSARGAAAGMPQMQGQQQPQLVGGGNGSSSWAGLPDVPPPTIIMESYQPQQFRREHSDWDLQQQHAAEEYDTHTTSDATLPAVPPPTLTTEWYQPQQFRRGHSDWDLQRQRAADECDTHTSRRAHFGRDQQQQQLQQHQIRGPSLRYHSRPPQQGNSAVAGGTGRSPGQSQRAGSSSGGGSSAMYGQHSGLGDGQGLQGYGGGGSSRQPQQPRVRCGPQGGAGLTWQQQQLMQSCSPRFAGHTGSSLQASYAGGYGGPGGGGGGCQQQQDYGGSQDYGSYQQYAPEGYGGRAPHYGSQQQAGGHYAGSGRGAPGGGSSRQQQQPRVRGGPYGGAGLTWQQQQLMQSNQPVRAPHARPGSSRHGGGGGG